MTLNTIPAIRIREEAAFWIVQNRPEPGAFKVSIVVPTYNAHATLERALRSALEQSLHDIEVIVVDDASQDSSWDIIRASLAEDHRLWGIRNKQNQGKSASMNHAISLARGEWIAVLDADDWFEPDRLATLVALGERRKADMVADNQYFYDAIAHQIAGTAWPPMPREWVLTFDEYLAGSDAYENFNFGMLKPVMRHDFIRRTALAYEPAARHGEDFLYLLRFYLLGGRASISDRPLYYYTQPFGALSRQWSHALRSRYDFGASYTFNQQYLAMAQGSLTPTQAACLARRSSKLKCLEYYFQLKERVAAANFASALALAIKHPLVLGYLMRNLFRRYVYQPSSNAVERSVARAPHIGVETGPPGTDWPASGSERVRHAIRNN